MLINFITIFHKSYYVSEYQKIFKNLSFNSSYKRFRMPIDLMNLILETMHRLFFLWLLFGFTETVKCAKTTIAIKQGVRNYNNLIATEANSFTDLIKESKIFVDNSMLIRDLIEMGPHSQTILWQGASNWGKTMNMDMVKMFFEMQFDEKGNVIPKEFTDQYKFFVTGEITLDEGTFQRLQTPLLIMHEKDQNGSSYIEYMGRNPIIRISFKNVDGWDPETRKQQIKDAISGAFKAHAYLSTKSPQSHKFNNYLHGQDWNNIGYSVRHLCEKLSAHVNRSESVLILIDDFDAPIINMLRFTSNFKSIEQILEIFTVLENLFRHTIHHEIGRSCMHRAIFTSKFKLPFHSYDKEYFLIDKQESISEYFGFSEENVGRLFDKCGIAKDLAQQALNYYGTNYSQILKQRFYNPASIAKFLHRKTLFSYWASNDLTVLRKMFEAKCGKNYQPSWFSQAETFLIALFTDQPINIRNDAEVLSFQYIDVIAKMYNRVATHKRVGYDVKCYREICLTFLLANGYLTKIPNTNQAKLLNLEMAVLLGDFVDSYCAYGGPMKATIPTISKFLDGTLNMTSPLKKAT